ncbi:DUF2637 domain-containing protein [Streptomyces ficellus]|uniref:DUF2637 domain-containing protein n=1 Tax=Streptomyces ficellus TaxID=1977088 RepID=A0A6I6EZN9_9ACTN|nr:DUF2637 domain-containing protein [Streptomyces ficellus]QGV77123.1 DUF2637 domain-containing protein [Streptomyces ficellus]
MYEYDYQPVGGRPARPARPSSGTPDPSWDTPDPSWDEELVNLLLETDPSRQWIVPPPTTPSAAPADTPAAHDDDLLEDLQPVTAELPPVRPPGVSHRRVPAKKRVITLLRTGSILIAALTAVIVAMVSVYGGMVTYGPLLRNATGPRASDAVLRWWPLLVYGPWLVASLSILRAAFHRRRATHSWSAVVLFSTIAMLLCVAQAPRTPLDAVAAGLPAVAALACFQQLVRQITLTRPPRQAAPRHRTAPAPARPHTAD